MIEGLSGVNATLLILSGGWLFFILRYQYMTRKDDNQSNSLFIYKWSVSFAAIGIFILSVLYFLFDFDLIYRSQHRDLGFITRVLFAAHLICAYAALGADFARKIIPVSIIIGVLVYMWEILIR